MRIRSLFLAVSILSFSIAIILNYEKAKSYSTHAWNWLNKKNESAKVIKLNRGYYLITDKKFISRYFKEMKINPNIFLVLNKKFNKKNYKIHAILNTGNPRENIFYDFHKQKYNLIIKNEYVYDLNVLSPLKKSVYKEKDGVDINRNHFQAIYNDRLFYISCTRGTKKRHKESCSGHINYKENVRIQLRFDFSILHKWRDILDFVHFYLNDTIVYVGEYDGP